MGKIIFNKSYDECREEGEDGFLLISRRCGLITAFADGAEKASIVNDGVQRRMTIFRKTMVMSVCRHDWRARNACSV